MTLHLAGVSAEEAGHPIDARAADVLRAAGYRTEGHSAHRITADEIRSASLVIGMEQIHLDRISRLVPGVRPPVPADRLRPGRASRAPASPTPGTATAEGFNETLAAIEAAMPELMRRARELARRSPSHAPLPGVGAVSNATAPTWQAGTMHILVVDDDQAVRDSLARSLQYTGYEVTTASDGVEALAHLSANRPDAVIMDVMMPRLDGLETTRMLRARATTSRSWC